MRWAGYAFLTLAGLGCVSACNIIFNNVEGRPPVDSPAFVGYAVGAMLVPIFFAIIGKYLIDRAAAVRDEQEASHADDGSPEVVEAEGHKRD
ncbi:hypothetical protein [Stratiformator vulcanicus]|uniref:Lipoprotein n=1 Tax=Stratiformator vulcanicus TaxID=2527980 RepID=A0A517QZK2_9PLAN|nr:hypothetical protein [Stratiformator vulcanicus]QDT37038.1 hypothetical protein Pan189_14040 [Stratiformator vulcanicus]